jgi:hypothetical protein
MSKHTEGPWKAMADGDNGFEIATADQDQMAVAYVYGENSEVGECDPVQAKADADLIAAAPELLAACQRALELRNKAYQVDANHGLDMLERRRIDREIQAIEGQIRIAIHKAGAGDPEDAIRICMTCGCWLFAVRDKLGYRECDNRQCKMYHVHVVETADGNK